MKTSSAPFPHSRSDNQLGLSLIELMISITIGLLILVSLSSMFINQSRARAELDKSNRMIDNGRYALELLSGNLRLAGFFYTLNPDTFNTPAAPAVITLFDPCTITTMNQATLNSNRNLILLHVQGYDAATSASQVANPPCNLTNATGTELSLKPGSDILAITRASTTPILQTAALNDGTIYLQTSGCNYDPPPGYLLSTDPTTLTMAQKNQPALANCFKPPNVPAAVPTAPYANVWPLKSELYFISPDNKLGDGIPTLKRRELSAVGGVGGVPTFITTPLVEGIEFMQVEYGIDDPALNSDNFTPDDFTAAGLDGVPDSFSSCAACTPEQWANVVSIKLYLVSRNIDPTRGYNDTKQYSLGTSGIVGPFNDSYKRHAYIQNVRLVNTSGRREPP